MKGDDENVLLLTPIIGSERQGLLHSSGPVPYAARGKSVKSGGSYAKSIVSRDGCALLALLDREVVYCRERPCRRERGIMFCPCRCLSW